MASDTFGINPSQLAHDVNKFLDRKERKRASKAQESLSKESINSAREKASVDFMNTVLQKKIGVGSASDKSKAKKKAEDDKAEKLRDAREKARVDRDKLEEQRKYDKQKAEDDQQRKIELEKEKAALKTEKALTPEQKVKERQRNFNEGRVADAIRNKIYEKDGEEIEIEINTPEEARAFATEQGIDFDSKAVNRAITMTFGTGGAELGTFTDPDQWRPQGGGGGGFGESSNTVTIKKNGMTIRYDFDKGTKTRIL